MSMQFPVNDPNKLPLTGGTLLGSLSLPNGSSSSPSLSFTHGGWFDDGSAPGLSIGGTQYYIFRNTGLTISVLGGGFAGNVLRGEGTTSTSQNVYSDTSGLNRFSFSTAKGTFASPTTVTNGFELCRFLIGGWGTTTFQFGGKLSSFCVDPSPSDTSMATSWRIYTAPVGSVAPSEIGRFDAANGFSMFGGSIVVDANRVFRRRVFTVATLPTGVDGMAAFVSDSSVTTFGTVVASGGTSHVPVYYTSDSAAWKVG